MELMRTKVKRQGRLGSFPYSSQRASRQMIHEGDTGKTITEWEFFPNQIFCKNDPVASCRETGVHFARLSALSFSQRRASANTFIPALLLPHRLEWGTVKASGRGNEDPQKELKKLSLGGGGVVGWRRKGGRKPLAVSYSPPSPRSPSISRSFFYKEIWAAPLSRGTRRVSGGSAGPGSALDGSCRIVHPAETMKKVNLIDSQEGASPSIGTGLERKRSSSLHFELFNNSLGAHSARGNRNRGSDSRLLSSPVRKKKGLLGCLSTGAPCCLSGTRSRGPRRRQARFLRCLVPQASAPSGGRTVPDGWRQERQGRDEPDLNPASLHSGTRR